MRQWHATTTRVASAFGCHSNEKTRALSAVIPLIELNNTHPSRMTESQGFTEGCAKLPNPAPIVPPCFSLHLGTRKENGCCGKGNRDAERSKIPQQNPSHGLLWPVQWLRVTLRLVSSSSSCITPALSSTHHNFVL